jgi:hypothetical protein
LNYHVFCSRGGCGSTALNRGLVRSGYTRHHASKPDVCFTRADLVAAGSDLYASRQIVGPAGYAERPSKPEAIAEFRRRADYDLDPRRTIADNLLAFLDHLERAGRTALFNTAAAFGFFRTHRIARVVFLVRHPLDAYASWTKPERHQDVVRSLGGIDADAALSLFARLWAATADEYLALRDRGLAPVLIRFESARSDAEAAAPELASVFDGWDSARRSRDRLPAGVRGRLLPLVSDPLSRLYPGDVR